MRRRRSLFGRRLNWLLLVAASFAVLAVGAFVGGAADIALVGVVITVLAIRGAYAAWRSESR